jgi:hypothetical protein
MLRAQLRNLTHFLRHRQACVHLLGLKCGGFRLNRLLSWHHWRRRSILWQPYGRHTTVLEIENVSLSTAIYTCTIYRLVALDTHRKVPKGWKRHWRLTHVVITLVRCLLALKLR